MDHPVYRRLIHISGLGIFLDGYDLSVMSVVLLYLHKEFTLTSLTITLLAASALLGAIAGGFLAGPFTDRLGRKPLYMTDLFFFALFSIISALAPNMIVLIVARFFLGVAIGADYAISSTYLSEFSPETKRGKHMGLLLIHWTVGAAISFVFGAVALLYIPGPLGWRLLLGLAAIPAIYGLWLRSQTPETTRWQERQKTKPRRLFEPKYRRRLLLITVPWFLFDFTAYGLGLLLPLLLHSLQLTSALGATIGTGLIATLGGIGNVMAIFLLDRSGRKPLQIGGFLGASAILTLGSILFGQAMLPFGALMIILILGNIALGLGPGTVTLIYPAELFPTRIRATAVGFATSISRLGAIAGVVFFEYIQIHAGLIGVLLTTTAATFLGGFFTWILGVETKNRTLEEISPEN